AGVDETAHAHRIAYLVAVRLCTDRRHAADDLVARHHRKDRAAPLVARQVDVGMADAAVEDVDLHVARAGHAAFDREGRQRRAGGLGGIGGDHGNLGIGGGGPNDAASAALQPASSTWPSPSASISATAAARAAWS